MKIKYCFLIIFTYPFYLFSQQVVINEFMSFNSSLKDNFDLNSDWIELYNNSTLPINLNNYGLSDNISDPFKWVLPDTIIPPQAYFIIWASGKNISTPGKPMHTNWKINKEGEILTLTSATNEKVDQINSITLFTDLSYGRFPNGSNKFYFFENSTPNKPNINNGISTLTDAIVFSKKGGFFIEPFHLTLTSKLPNTQIYFTLDGSEPEPSNVKGNTYTYKTNYPFKSNQDLGDLQYDTLKTFLYQEPFLINKDQIIEKGLFTKTPSTVIESNYNVNLKELQANKIKKSTIVRAVLYRNGKKISNVITNTYISRSEKEIDFSLPLISLTTCPSNLFSYSKGIYTAGEKFDNWRLNNLNENANAFTSANYHLRGKKSEIISNIEFYEVDWSSVSFNKIVGVRINGESGRSFPLKSFRIYLKEEANNKGLNFDLFDNKNKNTQTFLLRSAGDDQFKAHIRDVLVATISKPLNFKTQSVKASNLLINGEYWGLYYIRQRHDKYYINQFYKIPLDQIYIINEPIEQKIIENDIASTQFSNLYNFILDNDMSDSVNYSYVKSKIDFENLIDYNIANIFFGNTDWGDRNARAWKTKKINLGTNIKEYDGRWRWMMHDVDESFGTSLPEGGEKYVNVFEFISTWNSISAFNFKDNNDFVIQFSNRFSDILNTYLVENRTIPILDSLEQKIEKSIVIHTNRWGYPNLSKNIDDWHEEIDKIRNYLLNREKVQRDQLRDYFDLGDDYNLIVDVSDEIHGYIRVNTIDIINHTQGINKNPYPWSGTYFKGNPISIEAIPYKGWKFSHWKGINEKERKITIIPDKNKVKLKAVFIKI